MPSSRSRFTPGAPRKPAITLTGAGIPFTSAANRLLVRRSNREYAIRTGVGVQAAAAEPFLERISVRPKEDIHPRVQHHIHSAFRGCRLERTEKRRLLVGISKRWSSGVVRVFQITADRARLDQAPDQL